MNIADRTGAFEPDEADRTGCLKRFSVREPHDQSPHRIAPEMFPLATYRLVDPDKYQKRDPEDAIRRGETVDSAVDAGIAAGVLTFSEVVFDKSRTHAVFSFSFVCGGLCGHGWIVQFRKANGAWRQAKSNCSHWIS